MNAIHADRIEAIEDFGPVDLYQRREKIITRHVQGRFQRLRYYSGWPLLAGYFITPWLTWNGNQAVLFDLPARQFNIFALTIWPQDLWLAGWMLMIGALSLFTITNIVGRLWCGYTCPQTVWTAIFMWIEQRTEGSRTQRIRLDRESWSLTKLRKRGAKHVLWLGMAFLTGLTFVGYFTPIRELTWQLVTFDAVSLQVQGWYLFWIAFFTAATYINAGWMREQVCIYMCPYARFQSAMIDRDTLIVSYDATRGEPRGAVKRGNATADQPGDCVDCQLCVQVCPTGIDIRDGLQYQCIDCAHCVDACNQVMTKLDRAPDLISYTTLNALENKGFRWLRPRSIGYGLVAASLIVAFGVAVYLRAPLDLDVLRDRGTLFLETDTAITNEYQLKAMNKSQVTSTYQVDVLEPSWVKVTSDAKFQVDGGELVDMPLTLVAAKPLAPGIATNTEVKLRLCTDDGKYCAVEATPFLTPVNLTPGNPTPAGERL